MQISADYRNAKSKAGHHEGHEGHEGDQGKIKSRSPRRARRTRRWSRQNQKQVTTKGTKGTKVNNARSKAKSRARRTRRWHEVSVGWISGSASTIQTGKGGCAAAYPPYERRSSNGICGFFDLPFVSFVPFVVI